MPAAAISRVIDSGRIPTVRLSYIFRQAGESRIVINAHRILTGEMPESVDADQPNADFFVVPRRTPEEAAELVRELVVTRIPRRFGFDSKRDIQVLTPMHRGPVGTIALNELLQAALNPDGVPGRDRDAAIEDRPAEPEGEEGDVHRVPRDGIGPARHEKRRGRIDRHPLGEFADPRHAVGQCPAQQGHADTQPSIPAVS